MEEYIEDMRLRGAEELERDRKQRELMFRLRQTMPETPEYKKILDELFGDRLGEGSTVCAPINGAALHKLVIGRNVYINPNLLAMARGGITIEDDVQLAANVQLISNNHDLYERQILICRPILIRKGAWIGAGATIMPGVTVGKYAVIGSASVVTKDVPDYGVAVGNPARVIRMLDPERFEQALCGQS